MEVRNKPHADRYKQARTVLKGLEHDGAPNHEMNAFETRRTAIEPQTHSGRPKWNGLPRLAWASASRPSGNRVSTKYRILGLEGNQGREVQDWV